MPPEDRASTLAALAMDLQRTSSERPTAQAVIEQTLDLVPDAEWVSLTIRGRRGNYVTLASTSEVSERADELQYSLEEGPCIEAVEGADWYRSGDVGQDARWPRWGPEAARLGVGSLLSVQLMAGDGPVGALNMYAPAKGCFAERDDIDLAVLAAVHVAAALSSASQITGLQTAIASRHTIGVAQGILMNRYGISLDASFELLRRYSNTHNTKLAAVAAEIVETGGLPAEPTAVPQ
jgi:hypothetical protein